MLSERDKDQSVSDVALIEDVRTAAVTLVRRETYRVGSRMVAYENVAAMVGRSGSWLRQFIGRAPGVSVSFPVGMNIIAMYRRVCERIEASAEQMENAATQSTSAMAQSVAETSKEGEA